MRNLTILFLCAWLILPPAAFGTLPPTLQYDIRTAGNGGADTNAGAFDSGGSSCGTDESKGAGTAITITSAGTTGTGSPAFTSTTHGPCNTVIIASGAGCTTGTYDVVSQAAGVATFDRTMGAGTCVGVIGGSKLTVAGYSAVYVSGNTGWLQNGTFTQTTFAAFTTSGYASLIGYNSAHGDITTVAGLANAPTITSATNSASEIEMNGITALHVQNIKFTHTAATRGQGIIWNVNGGVAAVQNSTFDGFKWAIIGDNGSFSAGQLTASGIEVKNCQTGGAGIVMWWNIQLSNSYIHCGTSFDGVQYVGTNADHNPVFIRNIIAGNKIGITIFTSNNTHAIFSGNTIALNASDGIVGPGTTTTDIAFENNILYGNTGCGFNWTTTQAIFDVNRNNAYGSNTGGNQCSFTSPGLNDQTGISNQFNNSGSGDFSLVAGSPLLKAGYAGTFPGGLSVGSGLDIGAVQTSGGAASGGIIRNAPLHPF